MKMIPPSAPPDPYVEKAKSIIALDLGKLQQLAIDILGVSTPQLIYNTTKVLLSLGDDITNYNSYAAIFNKEVQKSVKQTINARLAQNPYDELALSLMNTSALEKQFNEYTYYMMTDEVKDYPVLLSLYTDYLNRVAPKSFNAQYDNQVIGSGFKSIPQGSKDNNLVIWPAQNAKIVNSTNVANVLGAVEYRAKMLDAGGREILSLLQADAFYQYIEGINKMNRFSFTGDLAVDTEAFFNAGFDTLPLVFPLGLPTTFKPSTPYTITNFDYLYEQLKAIHLLMPEYNQKLEAAKYTLEAKVQANKNKNLQLIQANNNFNSEMIRDGQNMVLEEKRATQRTLDTMRLQAVTILNQ